LKNSDTWGKVILNFAELKNLSGGAINDLVNAINDLVDDLNAKN
jgi:hypothetical protein